MALTGEQWDRIEALLPEVLELAPAERQRFLDRHCPAELRLEIEAMVAASEAGNGGLDRPVGLTAPEEAGQSLSRGELLGAWRIDSLLGSGGMGEVYAAERADGSYEQRVALKLLKRGIDTQAVLSRFLRERRILARLTHPNIARLFDAGAASDGRPYLVMERVDGLPIDQWCQRQALPLRRRLELMCQVCEAVYAAHREQIVHRDLKPSNVLVTAAGEAKLLDFGVSKLAGEDGGEQTRTMLGIAPLTLDYASPEQLLGQPVTPATDVYALGLLLYRLLTGELPHARSSLPAALATAGKDDRVTRPSLVLRKHAESDPGRRPAQARELDGDLDQIILKTLQREPARRYANAAELADDLRRHLDGRPVLAQPDSRWYVARKFIARNWVPVSAAAAVSVALVLGLGVAIWQAHIATEEVRKTKAVKDFLVGIFNQNSIENVDGARARATTAEQLLAIGSQKIKSELKNDPEARAEMLGVIGSLYGDLFLDEKAIDALQSQLAQLQVLHGDQPTPEALQAHVELGCTLSDSNQYEQSERELEQAFRMFSPLGDRTSELRAKALECRAQNAYHDKPAMDGTARDGFREAVALLRNYHPQSALLVSSLTGLAHTEEKREENAAAQTHYLQAVEFAKTLDPKSHPVELASAEQQYGSFLTESHRYGEGIPYLREALALFTRSAGPDNALTLDAGRELANALCASGHRMEGLLMLKQQLQKLEHSSADSAADAAVIAPSARLNLATQEYLAGRLSDAEAHFRQNIAYFEQSRTSNISLAVNLARNVRVLLAQGRLQDAQGMFDRSKAMILEEKGEKSASYAYVIGSAGDLALERGNAAEAEALFRGVLGTGPQPENSLQPYRMHATIGLSQALIATGRAADAAAEIKPLLDTLLKAPEAAFLKDDEAALRQQLGIALLAMDQAQMAEPELHSAVELRQSLEDPLSPFLARARLQWGECLARLGRRQDARGQVVDAAQAMSGQTLGESFQRELIRAKRRVE